MSQITLANTATVGTPATGKTAVYVDATKRLAQKDDAGVVSQFAVQSGSGAVAQSSPSNPTGSTSGAGVMMGLGGSITPATTGRIFLMISGTIFNPSGIADGAAVQLRHGTGAAPANGDALTGTAVGGLQKYVSSTTAGKVPFAVQAIVTGLSLNAAHWLDVGLAQITGGTATLTDISLSAFEF